VYTISEDDRAPPGSPNDRRKPPETECRCGNRHDNPGTDQEEGRARFPDIMRRIKRNWLKIEEEPGNRNRKSGLYDLRRRVGSVPVSRFRRYTIPIAAL